MPRTKQRTPELKDHVLSVAVEMLARDGVVGFTARGVARDAATSTPAVYELFGDKGGLVREVFFSGFRKLFACLESVPESADQMGDLVKLLEAYRRFMVDNPVLTEVMFSRPFTDFDPGPSEVEASSSVRILIVQRVRRCVEAGHLRGDVTDIAHGLVSLVQGLAAAENAGRLGTSPESVGRRWSLAVGALLRGFS